MIAYFWKLLQNSMHSISRTTQWNRFPSKHNEVCLLWVTSPFCHFVRNTLGSLFSETWIMIVTTRLLTIKSVCCMLRIGSVNYVSGISHWVLMIADVWFGTQLTDNRPAILDFCLLILFSLLKHGLHLICEYLVMIQKESYMSWPTMQKLGK